MSSRSRLLFGRHRSERGALKRLQAAGLCLLALEACAPKAAHEPSVYPALKVQASALRLELVDERPAPAVASREVLLLPEGIAASLQARLDRLRAESGIELSVRARVATAQAVDLVDSRGEMTRIAVDLDFETRAPGGPLFRRGRGHSQTDIPRDEASDAEVASVLAATALDAFDRYWALPATLNALNADIAAYAKQQPPPQ